MRRAPLIIAFSVCLCGLALYWRGASRLSQIRREIEDARARTSALSAEIDQAHEKLRSTRAAVQSASAARSLAVGRLAREKSTAAEADRETLWSEPPKDLPAWEPASPYFWISKDLLATLPITPFESDGRLSSPVAATLALSPEKLQSLNRALEKIVTEYHGLQSAAAHTTTNHLSSEPGQKVTVVLDPAPESGAKRLREEYENTLRAGLSPQQFDLIRRLGSPWMEQNLLPQNAEPRIYSAVRHLDGTYGLTIKGASDWSSMSGFARLEDHVPKYLLPWFADLQQKEEGE